MASHFHISVVSTAAHAWHLERHWISDRRTTKVAPFTTQPHPRCPRPIPAHVASPANVCRHLVPVPPDQARLSWHTPQPENITTPALSHTLHSPPLFAGRSSPSHQATPSNTCPMSAQCHLGLSFRIIPHLPGS